MTTVTHPAFDSAGQRPEPFALCLSGGGFRATLFHLGVLRRLNELGLLARVGVISSVSGGSILNGVLAARWAALGAPRNGIFANFDDIIAGSVRDFCRRDLRTPLMVGERLNPFRWPGLAASLGAIPANALARAYSDLMQGMELGQLPSPGGGVPRFVFCATNVRTGACWHFHGGPGGRMGDFYTGYAATNGVTVADAVAASSAFPPGFGALRLEAAHREFTRTDPWGADRELPGKRAPLGEDARKVILLSDGGVYDNLGVEPVWNSRLPLIVSDAGRPFSSQAKCSQAIISRLSRAASISMEQVGAVRKRWLVERFQRGERAGALWAINTRLQDFGLSDARGYSAECRELFSRIRTDLNSFSEGEMACLENHGYSLADAALRSRAVSLGPSAAPFEWPHADWSATDNAQEALRTSGRRRLPRDIARFCLNRLRPRRSRSG